MKKYFWREKNADKFIGKNEVIVPTKSELEQELILKLEQKRNRMIMIFDKKAREEYFGHDEKPKEFKLEDYEEEEIQKMIGYNCAVDFLQLVYDMCTFYNYKAKPYEIKSYQTFDSINEQMKETINNLKTNPNFKEVTTIYSLTTSLIRLLNLDYKKVEARRKELEEKQGTFFKGKYVIK